MIHRKWFQATPGFTDDPGMMRTASVLNRTLLIFSILMGIGFIAALVFFEPKMGATLAILVMLAATVAAKLLMQVGKIRQAGIVAVTVGWLTFACIVLVDGGLNSINACFFISMTIVAGLLLGTRAATFFAGVGIVTGLVLALLDHFSYLPYRYFVDTPLGDWSILVFALVLASSTLNLALRERDSALGIAEQQLSEHRKTEEALRRSEEKYRLIAENSAELITVTDMNLHFTYISPSITRTHGFTIEEAMNRSLDQYMTPESMQVLMTALEEEMKREAEGNVDPSRTRVFEVEEYRKDGSTIWLESSMSGLRDKDDKLVGILTVSRDITERKRMEKALQESEELYRTSLESSSDGIAIVHEGRYVYVNQPFLDKIGRRRDEIVGKTRGKFIHPDDQAAFMDYVDKITRGLPTPKQVEIRVLLPDGTFINAEVSMVRVTYKGNRCNLAYLRDITDRKRAEAEHLKVQKLESVGTLAAGIAHDFNNLLAVIQGYIELLKMDIPPGEKVQNRLRATEKAISQATELTNRLLVFSKGGEPVKQVLDVSDLIKDAVLRILGASPVEKRFHLDRDLWPVEVDERQIHQVIRNLAINAAEAMPEGGRLAIRAENTMVKVQDKLPIRPGAYIRISVEDTGKGIPTDELPLIFDPYFSTKQRGAQKGMGLGLSVCHSVVTKHNGCITLESKEGRGSTFRVYLPAAVSVTLPSDERPPEGLSGAKGRILVMDDEAMIRDMLKELLTAMGYEVETTSDGLAAIDLYIRATESQRPYRMVILDLMVPGGLGGEPTMERLRAIDPGVRGIILSGYSDDPVIQDYAQYGFVEALTKPFSLKALQDVLEKHP